jgi:trehalose/maltose hydrolase-like predicted phosphorylase
MLRMHAYHLLCTTSPHNEHIDFGIPARGLTGEAYRGHIFWDELYILPFYHIHFREIVRSVLMYRYRRLDAARDYAREHGYRGAMFPWQSGSKGTEETQKYHFNPVSGTWGDDHSSLQRHVSLAIAFNILQYHHINEDDAFMLHYGAEMILEICRFWASMARLDPASGRYSISRVMGPDEFHESYPGHEEGGLTDNTYTNIMAVWMFEKALRYLERLNASDREQVCKKIALAQEELVTWKEITEKIRVVINEEGILAQYDGYFELKELDWDDYRKRYGNIYRLDRILKAEGKSPDAYKVAKQADTLMLWYNLDAETVSDILARLGYKLPADYLSRNLEYYLKRTSHGSTLSRVVHAYLAIRTGRMDLSWELFSDAVTSDYNDIQGGTTAEGIHTGVMAGTILVALTAYAGLDLSGDSPKINPQMPTHWRRMKFSFWFRGIRYFCVIEDNKATITT